MKQVAGAGFVMAWMLGATVTASAQSSWATNDLAQRAAYCREATGKQLGTMLAIEVALPPNTPPNERAALKGAIQTLSRDLKYFQSYLDQRAERIDSTTLAKTNAQADADVDAGMKAVRDCRAANPANPDTAGACLIGSPARARVQYCKGAGVLPLTIEQVK